MEDYKELLSYCTTDREEEIFEWLSQNPTQRGAARHFNLDRKTISEAVKRVRRKAAARGYAPDMDRNTPVPQGFGANTSTHYKITNNGQRVPTQQWVKTYKDEEELKQIREAILQGMIEQIPTRSLKHVKSPKQVESELCNLYVITDYHLGMKADAEDTASDGSWDLRIAEETLVRWFTRALVDAPNAEVGVLCQLGDFLHWDGLDAVTPQNKHILDADDRFNKVVATAIRVLRQVVEMMLQKHERVHIIHAEGNHDMASSVWLRWMFETLYSGDDRITVDTNPDPYYCFEWGKTSLFFHHGHKRKPPNIDDIFVAKFRPVFGRTLHSYAHMGHLHHDRVIESNLMTVEQHQTLAAKDAFAARGGWMAGRSARVITYHKEYGKLFELSISAAMANI